MIDKKKVKEKNFSSLVSLFYINTAFVACSDLTEFSTICWKFNHG